jgi:hypothetical protein
MQLGSFKRFQIAHIFVVGHTSLIQVVKFFLYMPNSSKYLENTNIKGLQKSPSSHIERCAIPFSQNPTLKVLFSGIFSKIFIHKLAKAARNLKNLKNSLKNLLHLK